MIESELRKEYFGWMYHLVCEDRYAYPYSYEQLMSYLHSVEFVWYMPMDKNRAHDGISLRHRFGLKYDIEDAEEYLEGPCSVLEMMVALAIRCEEDFMDDPHYGDRTSHWFWRMIVSLGLGSMTDIHYDEPYVEMIVQRFLDRDYLPNGEGGLFTIKDSEEDLRGMEIWYQLCRYINYILGI